MVPLGVAQTILADPMPWWMISVHKVLVTAGIYTVIYLFLVLTLIRFQFFAKGIFLTWGAGWVTWIYFLASQNRGVGLGFLGFAIGIYWILICLTLFKELARSYWNPKLRWYEGVPAAVPQLICRIEEETEVRLSRADQDGLFVFLKNPPTKLSEFFGRKKKMEVSFSFQGTFVRCFCRPTVEVTRSPAKGYGLRFDGNSPDIRKEIGDLLERLRVEGYVNS